MMARREGRLRDAIETLSLIVLVGFMMYALFTTTLWLCLVVTAFIAVHMMAFSRDSRLREKYTQAKTRDETKGGYHSHENNP